MPRILLVDDDDPFRRMLREMLVRAGHEVLDASDGDIALKLDQENPSELVVIDLVMPEKEGLETIMELRRRRPDARIIAMSGSERMNTKVNLVAAKKLGARRILVKPFLREAFLQAIDEVLAEPAD